MVCLGMARHGLAQALPAHPPPPGHWRAGFPLLLRARAPAGVAVPADPRGRVPPAGGRKLRAWQGLFRARPVLGPALHRDRPAHGAGHGCPGDLRRHRRPAAPPHRHTGLGPARPAPARRPRDDPAHRPGDRPNPRPSATARRRPALASMATLSPGPLSLVPPAHPTGQRRCARSGQLANGYCRTSRSLRRTQLPPTACAVIDSEQCLTPTRALPLR
jgi:hypothetical protein